MLIVRFRHLSHMLSQYVQLHARLFGSMRALLHAYLVGSIFCLSLVYMHCLYVRLGTTMYPMCVRAANALMRLCICPGSPELSMLTYKQISLPYLVGMCFK